MPSGRGALSTPETDVETKENFARVKDKLTSPDVALLAAAAAAISSSPEPQAEPDSAFDNASNDFEDNMLPLPLPIRIHPPPTPSSGLLSPKRTFLALDLGSARESRGRLRSLSQSKIGTIPPRDSRFSIKRKKTPPQNVTSSNDIFRKKTKMQRCIVPVDVNFRITKVREINAIRSQVDLTFTVLLRWLPNDVFFEKDEIEMRKIGKNKIYRKHVRFHHEFFTVHFFHTKFCT